MYILSIDQGTTGTTAVLIDAKSYKIIDKVNEEFPQIFPKPGWVEHNLNDIWNTVKSTISTILKKHNVDSKDIKTIGITNQRETTCAFKKDGTPLHNAIVWQDRRTHEFCQSLKTHENNFKTKAGLPLDPYFSGTKMNWLLNNSDEVKSALKSDDLLFGTIDTFLLYKLTGGSSHKTDASNASRTLLMNLDTCQWDNELCDVLGVSTNNLPEICDSISDYGQTKGLSFLADGISINGILGDQQAALFGQACFNEGEGKCTYGTGAFMLVNTGENKKYSDNGLLTTVAYKHNGKTIYALEGSSYIAGACVQWLRDNLKFFESSPEVESCANKVTDLNETRDVYLFPFFTGIGSPYWKAEAKAALVGLTRGTGINEISRVALEGICFSINDLFKASESDFGNKIKEMKVDGGAVANNLLMQIQSDISEFNVVRPEVIETTAYGAALAASIGAGIASMDDIKNLWKEDKVFSPQSDSKEYFEHKKIGWTDYIKRNFL